MPYSFKSKDVAVQLRDFANTQLGGNGYGPGRQRPFNFQNVILVKTPTEGCNAREATTPDNSSRNEWKTNYVPCEVLATYGPDSGTYREDGDDIHTSNRPSMEDATGSQSGQWQNDASMAVNVHNVTDSHIEGDALYYALWLDGTYVFLRHGSEVRIFLSPFDGIPGRVGSTLGSAECSLFYLTDAGVITGVSGVTRTVYNMGLEDVGNSVYIQAVEINGLMVANWEECS